MTRKITAIFSALFLVFTLSMALPLDSDAARMGGGRSFGSQPAMRSPAPASTVQPRTQQAAPNRQQAAAAQQQPSRGGLFGGFAGGMLGGLLAGTLLGSLLGGGAFSGFGMMDILLVLIIIGIVVVVMRRKRAAQQMAAQSAVDTPSWNAQQQQPTYDQGMQRNSVQDAWSGLSGNQQAASAYGASIPADFDVEDFLRGAKMAYTRMQASWDKRDLDDIAHFATDAVLEELREQAKADPNPSQTQIVLINAHVLSVEEFGAMDRVQVYFDVLLREDPSQTQPANAREIWHFVRPHKTGSWKLDGIQQVEGC